MTKTANKIHNFQQNKKRKPIIVKDKGWFVEVSRGEQYYTFQHFQNKTYISVKI